MRTVLSSAARPRTGQRRRSWLALLVGLALVLGPLTTFNAFATGSDLARNDDESRATKTRRTLTSVLETMQLVDPALLGPERVAQLAQARAQVDLMTDGELDEMGEQLGPELEKMNDALNALRDLAPGGGGGFVTPLIDPGFPNAAYPVYIESVGVSGTPDPSVQAGACADSPGTCVLATATNCSGTGQSTCSAGQVCLSDKCSTTHGDCSPSGACATGTCSGATDSDSCDTPAQENSSSVDMAFTWGCDRTERSTVEEAYGALIAFIAAEAVRDVASRVCNQELGILVAGGNVSVLCIITDVIYITAKSVYTNIDLCDAFIDDAEIEATYSRLEHVHVDIEQHDANIKGDISAATTAINDQTSAAAASLDAEIELHDDEVEAKLALHDSEIKTKLTQHDVDISAKLMQHDTDVKAELTQHDTEIKADVTQHDLDIKALLAQVRAAKLRLELEEALYRNERDAIYYLPEPAGNAALARQIVVDAMANVTASGESVNYAQGKLNTSDLEAARGNHKRAFFFLSQAYFEAIKIIGERQ